MSNGGLCPTFTAELVDVQLEDTDDYSYKGVNSDGQCPFYFHLWPLCSWLLGPFRLRMISRATCYVHLVFLQCSAGLRWKRTAMKLEEMSFNLFVNACKLIDIFTASKRLSVSFKPQGLIIQPLMVLFTDELHIPFPENLSVMHVMNKMILELNLFIIKWTISF